MKVALVHDYLNQWGGAERVLWAIHELWPEASVYTAIYDRAIFSKIPNPKSQTPNKPQILNPKFKNWQVIAPQISRLPLISRFYKFFTFLYPLVFEGLDLSEFDVIISSSSNFAKGVITRPGQVHICYCHTPPRFLYHYSTEGNFRKHWFWGKILPLLDNFLRVWDFLAAQRVDFFVANSQEVAGRIKKFYKREAVVIYPPVDVEKWEAGSEKWDIEVGGLEVLKKGESSRTSPYHSVPLHSEAEGRAGLASHLLHHPSSYFLSVSRLARYKNIDIIIKACNQLKLDLIVVGDGPESGRLQKLAGPTVKLVGRVGDRQLARFFRDCQAVVCAAQDEDFGIVPVEAMSFGKPVIALRSGGYQETVIEGETGIFFAEPTAQSLIGVLADFTPDRYSVEACRARAQKFSPEHFQRQLAEFVAVALSVKA